MDIVDAVEIKPIFVLMWGMKKEGGDCDASKNVFSFKFKWGFEFYSLQMW